MRRFIVSVLCLSVFFTGLGLLVERTSAKFKSDDRALELIRKARQAIGGEAAIGGVRSMSITGRVTKTFEFDGAARTENGEIEINFELPNRMARNVKFGSGEGSAQMEKQFDVLVMRRGEGDNLRFKTEGGEGVKKFTITKKDGSNEEISIDGKEPVILRKSDGDAIVSEDGKTATIDGRKVFIDRADGIATVGKVRSNELLRTTLALLLTAPEGLEVSYTFAGEGAVDGVSCDIVAASDGGSVIRLYLDKSTNLPRMMTYQGYKPFMIRLNRDAAQANADGETKVLTRPLDAPEKAEFQVKFSDYRAVNGLQLPHRWTQTVAGKDDEVVDITAYDLNPANIAEKFKEQLPVKVFKRIQKEQ